ncbi:MAG: thioredoxin-dependent thiol peroxidase [Candidatus Hydrogenedentota bacterium]
MLKADDPVPEFSLKGSDGKTYSPKSLRGKKWVLYFYPKDMTPGCTREACDFTDNIQRFVAGNTIVLGVSGGSMDSKKKFIEESSIGFPLLADEDFLLAKAFGSWGEKKNYGKTYMGLIRSTFLVNESGRIEKVWSNVKVDGHVDKVLDALYSLVPSK